MLVDIVKSLEDYVANQHTVDKSGKAVRFRLKGNFEITREGELVSLKFVCCIGYKDRLGAVYANKEHSEVLCSAKELAKKIGGELYSNADNFASLLYIRFKISGSKNQLIDEVNAVMELCGESCEKHIYQYGL